MGFLAWDTSVNEPLVSIETTALDKDGNGVGDKSFYNLPNDGFLSNWMARLKKNDAEAVPLINAITATTKTEHVRNTKWSDGAIGHFFCNGNDLQNAGTMTAIFSSVHSIGHAGGYFITEENLWQAAIVFSQAMVTGQPFHSVHRNRGRCK